MSEVIDQRTDPVERNVPENFYASVVRSLYEDPKTLLVGILSLAIAPLVLFWRSDDTAQLIFSASFLVFGLARLILAREFHTWSKENRSHDEYSVWENRYLFSSSIYIGVMGIWTIYCFWFAHDPFAEMMSICLSLCFLIGIVGRNFGSKKLIFVQSLTGSLTIAIALIGTGDPFNIVMSAFLLPYFVAVRFMALRLCDMLYSSEIAADDNRTIATRLDTALESITHGIAMISHAGQIIVSNERFLVLTNMAKTTLYGEDLSVLKRSKILTANGETLFRRITKHLEARTSSKFTYRLPDDRIVEADFNAIDEGGVVVLTDITERVLSEKAIRDLANYDALTKLPNRRFFISEVERRLMRRGELRPCSMYFVDLDKFKEVNDTLGHETGDKLLKTISARFSRVLKNTDLMCRFGGDEFVIVVPGVVDEQTCSEIASRLISELSQTVNIDHHRIKVGASVGIAVAPRDAKTPEELLQFTDAALYESKAKGRGLFTFYSEELGGEIKLKRELEIDLKTAIREETLDIHFQPLVNLVRGRITTCEALARWNHPVYGHISPDRFIKIAEDCGLIGELGNYVIRKSMLECLAWGNDVRVAVNVSGIQFRTCDLLGTVSRLLRETRLEPDRLEIEITESVLLNDFDEAITTLQRLAQLGVRISLDDFGTGFSSLSYLHQLPLHKVKIDRSFINSSASPTKTFTLLKGVVDLTKALGLTVVLEGIETEDQMHTIAHQMEIDEVQGFLFSRPLPSHDIRELLGTSRNLDKTENRIRSVAG